MLVLVSLPAELPRRKDSGWPLGGALIEDSEGSMVIEADRQGRRVKLSFFVASFELTTTVSSFLTLTATCETPTHLPLCGEIVLEDNELQEDE